MKTLIALFIICNIGLANHSLAAITIKNLDDISHQITTQFAEETPEIITILPNGKWQTLNSRIKVRVISETCQNRNMILRDNDKAIIWNGGKLGIQHRRNRKDKSAF